MPAASSRQSDRDAPIIERVTVTDGTVIFFNRRDQVEDRLTDVNVRTIMDADHQINLSAHAQAGDHPLTFEVKATLPSSWSERQTIPVELKLDVSGLLPAQLTAKAEARLNGSVVMINGIAGAIGDGAFNGWASVELASKPLVKLDLDFQRLDFAVPPSQNGQRRSSQAWSDVAFDLIGLNYIDAQIKLSAAALNLGDAHFAPAAIDGTLANGVVRCGVSNLGTYGGQANGEIGIDASGATPVYTMRGDLTGVRALPLLQGLAGFDWLDGKLQAGIAVRSTGASQRAILSNVAGTVSTSFQDGALRGLNVTQMIRTLTSNPLSGWPTGKEQITDLSHLSASFRIENGQAATSDLNLVGPLVKMTGAGTIDLGQQSLSLRVEPKLVMTHEGQGRAPNEPIGFGVPVIINGPWTGPRIYPDVAGILDDPEAAYSKLKEIGKGLFGAGGPSGDPNGAPPNSPDGRPGETLGETLGNLIQQGLNQGLGRGRNQSAKPGDPPPAPDGAAIKDMLQQFLNR
jgi:AsmA protein